jgi:hypothetical protein
MRPLEKVATEEIELVGEERLVCGAVVDIEVIDSRVGAELTERRLAGGGDGGAGPCHAIGLADADKPGAMETPRVPGGSEGRPEQPA